MAQTTKNPTISVEQYNSLYKLYQQTQDHIKNLEEANAKQIKNLEEANNQLWRTNCNIINNIGASLHYGIDVHPITVKITQANIFPTLNINGMFTWGHIVKSIQSEGELPRIYNDKKYNLKTLEENKIVKSEDKIVNIDGKEPLNYRQYSLVIPPTLENLLEQLEKTVNAKLKEEVSVIRDEYAKAYNRLVTQFEEKNNKKRGFWNT
jgi:hypothetical protein